MENLSIIVATAANGGIGKDNKLPWHLPEDLKYFKRLTTGHPVIMGRKTFESMGKALPNRRNIVISHKKDLSYPDAEVVNSLESAVSLCGGVETFVIGGAEIFKLALPVVSTLYITEIHSNFEADTFFPPLNPVEWKEVNRDNREPDEKNKFSYSFVTYKKIC